ncbi:cytochrome P450 family protein [Ceratobasidium sp. AG-Ba]|nr:cytochrome P450 family protein [Ceratobasidium sp. AG-Ba]
MSLLGIACISLGSIVLARFGQLIWIGRRLKAHKYWIFHDAAAWRLIMIPTWTEIPWVVYGSGRPYEAKHQDYIEAGTDGYIQMALTAPNCPTIFLADPQAIKEATRPRSAVLQDVELAKDFLGLFGPNVSTLEGDRWKHHRKISQRAFTEKNLQVVCSETVLVTEQLLDYWNEQQGRVVSIPQITDTTEKIALMVISSAALGQRLSWNEDESKSPPKGYDTSFQKALTVVSRQMLLRLAVPPWAEGWTAATRGVATGFRDYKKYLHDMLASYSMQGRLDEEMMRTKGVLSAPADNLFNIMVSASKQAKIEEGEGLADEEVVGNAFLFLFAGHETTSHALSFSFGLLALYPEIQQEAYMQLVFGIFMESLRLYPVLPQIQKITAEDTVISVARNGSGTDENDRENIAVPAGSTVVFSHVATHHNPRYWPEPEEFRPTRFTEPYNKDAFLSFGVGRRSCIGRKFAETEAVAVLATVLARYKISVDSTKFKSIPGESILARRERFLKRPSYYLAAKPGFMPLLFTRR